MAVGRFVDADEDEGRIEGDGGDGVGGHPVEFVAEAGGDDGDAGGEAAHHGAKLVPAGRRHQPATSCLAESRHSRQRRTASRIGTSDRHPSSRRAFEASSRYSAASIVTGIRLRGGSQRRPVATAATSLTRAMAYTNRNT